MTDLVRMLTKCFATTIMFSLIVDGLNPLNFGN